MRLIRILNLALVCGVAMSASAYDIRAFEDSIKPDGIPVSVDVNRDKISEFSIAPARTSQELPSLCSDWVPTEIQAQNPYLLNCAGEPRSGWDSAKEWIASNLFTSSSDMFSLGKSRSEFGATVVPNPWFIMGAALVCGSLFARYRRAD